jgi:hypothetical protein
MGVEPRSITNYVKKHEDFPSRKKGNGSREFPACRCLAWQRDRAVADAVASLAPRAPSDLEEAELRSAIAKAELDEIKVARARREVVPVAAAAAEFREMAGRIRAAVIAKRGEYRTEMLNLSTLAQSDAKLQALTDEILEELQTSLSTHGDLPGDEDAAPLDGTTEDEPPAGDSE